MPSFQDETRKIIVIITLCVGGMLSCVFSLMVINANNRQQEQIRLAQLYQKDDPLGVSRMFINAIGDKDFQLAKILIASQQEYRLDGLKKVSRSWNMNCCTISTFFYDSCGWGGGKYAEDENSNKKIVADYSYGCIDNRSMSIDMIIVEYDGTRWTITDWSEICINPEKYETSEICFP